MSKKEICHVCKKIKKPYIVFMNNNTISFVEYMMARKRGPICERCDKYYARTGIFKNASKEEFNIAREAQKFANLMLHWWEKDKKINHDDFYGDSDMREWEGTSSIAEWYRGYHAKNK